MWPFTATNKNGMTRGGGRQRIRDNDDFELIL
jgi:hypothetical protein